jgi:hypothetical protein
MRGPIRESELVESPPHRADFGFSSVPYGPLPASGAREAVPPAAACFRTACALFCRGAFPGRKPDSTLPEYALNTPASAATGEVAEWSIAPHSKCGIRATVSGVQIPPSPPAPFRARFRRATRADEPVTIERVRRNLCGGSRRTFWKFKPDRDFVIMDRRRRSASERPAGSNLQFWRGTA